MSSCVADDPSTTPSTTDDPVTRMDAMFGVLRYARLLSSPPTATDADTNAAVMTDWRIVRVTGLLVHSDILGKVLWFVGQSIEGVHVKTIPIVTCWCVGMAVNPSETLMVVSCSENGGRTYGNKLHLYSLPGGELLRTICEKGAGPGQLFEPRRVIFGPDDVIIVADRGNNRLQEFTSTGEYKRSIPMKSVFSIAISNNQRMIGVGSGNDVVGSVSLFDYASGVVLRTVSGGFTSIVSGILFVPDDSHILVASRDLRYVKLISVADGAVVKCVCTGLHYGLKYLCYAPNGDIIVADQSDSTTRVFSPDGLVLKLQLDSGVIPGIQLKRVSVVSVAHSRLYLLDTSSSCVQVFE